MGNETSFFVDPSTILSSSSTGTRQGGLSPPAVDRRFGVEQVCVSGPNIQKEVSCGWRGVRSHQEELRKSDTAGEVELFWNRSGLRHSLGWRHCPQTSVGRVTECTGPWSVTLEGPLRRTKSSGPLTDPKPGLIIS